MSNPPGYNQKNGKQCCLPPLSFKISLKNKLFHISLNSLGFHLYPQYWIFPNLYIPPCMGKVFNLWCSHSWKIHWIYAFLLMPVPHSKLQAGFLENLFPARWKGWRKPLFALWKFNQKIWRWLYILYDSQRDCFTVL